MVSMGLEGEFMMLVKRILDECHSLFYFHWQLDNGDVEQLLGTRCDPYGMNLWLTSVLIGAK